MKPRVNLMRLGRATHVVTYHDGVKVHKDGSPFYDIQIFRNEEKAKRFVAELVAKGYARREVLE